jgi:WhiB family redox-sensing transcriptional regulator
MEPWNNRPASRSTRPRGPRTVRVPYADVRWMTDALCNETDGVEFFPKKGGRTEPACRICESCRVRLDCLAYALEHEIVDGVWGGYGPKDLRTLLQKRSGTLDRRETA